MSGYKLPTQSSLGDFQEDPDDKVGIADSMKCEPATKENPNVASSWYTMVPFRSIFLSLSDASLAFKFSRLTIQYPGVVIFFLSHRFCGISGENKDFK